MQQALPIGVVLNLRVQEKIEQEVGFRYLNPTYKIRDRTVIRAIAPFYLFVTWETADRMPHLFRNYFLCSVFYLLG